LKGISLLVHRCEKCVEIKGDYWKIAKLFHFCHLETLVRPETFGPYFICLYVHSLSCLFLYPNIADVQFWLLVV
jgi:hypothetical protein